MHVAIPKAAAPLAQLLQRKLPVTGLPSSTFRSISAITFDGMKFPVLTLVRALGRAAVGAAAPAANLTRWRL